MLLQRVITAVVLLIIIIGALFNFPSRFHGGGRDCHRMLLLGVAPDL